MAKAKTSTFSVADAFVSPGDRLRLEIPVARLPTGTMLSISLEAINGARPGPTVWLSAAVHGDEVNGVEIIQQVLQEIDARSLAGRIIAVPIVNVFGFAGQSRYLPDRRDLNRSFPGSQRGSMAARLAHLFMTQVVEKCKYGIDLHTGSNHRTNLPQIRANLSDPETLKLAKAFAAPVLVNAKGIEGSLRLSATSLGIRTLVYEAGEPLRFDQDAIRLGRDGVLRVLAALEMRRRAPKREKRPSVITDKTTWIRARRSGILRIETGLGKEVEAKQQLGSISDTFGDNAVPLLAPCDGVVIGHTNNPLVQQGDAVIHLAESPESA